jgi:dTDP-4-amino-4,6-dideoxygalactose transaminase
MATFGTLFRAGLFDSRQETIYVIPRHAPPFGLAGLLSIVAGSRAVSEASLEKFCATEFGVPQAVLLPSARSAILLALKAAGESVRSVVAPAYTCGVVHQAIRLSGLPYRFVDSERGGYLMSAGDLCEATAGSAAVVLCEIYGLQYPASVAMEASGTPAMRIWDMAMGVPQAEDLRRLADNDVAVFSFGIGKCLFSGWGGLLLTRSTELAARVRELRKSVAQESFATRVRHGSHVFAITASHMRLVYGAARAMAERRYARQPSREASPRAAEPPTRSEATLSREWTEPMTPLNRKVALANLRRLSEQREQRLRKCKKYYRSLKPLGVVRGFDTASLPESHFPIRVASALRNSLRQYLVRRGIDTATYFPFPNELKRSDFPQAAEAADEVVLLPLGPCIRESEVPVVARHVAEALQELAI